MKKQSLVQRAYHFLFGKPVKKWSMGLPDGSRRVTKKNHLRAFFRARHWLPVLILAIVPPVFSQSATGVDLRTIRNVPISRNAGPTDDGTIRVFSTNFSTGMPSNGNTGVYTVTPGTGTWPVSQSGGWTVTPGTGTWPVSIAATLQVLSQQFGGSYTVTPGSGTWTISGTVSAAQAGTWNVLAAQNGSYTVTPGTGTWGASQVGSYTVTPGTGSWTVSGTVAATQSGSWSVAQSGAWSVASTQSGSYTVTPGTGTFQIAGPVSQNGSWTVTAGTGTWPITGSVSVLNFPATQNVQNVPGQAIAIVSTGIVTVGGSVSVSNLPSIQAVSQSGSFTVTPGTGTWNATGSSVTAYQGGAWTASVSQLGSWTTTPGTGTWPVSGAFFQSTQPVSQGSLWNLASSSTVARQDGSYTVTPGTGTFPVSGTFFQSVQPVSQNGAWTVTPGTGAWSTSGSSVTSFQGGSWTVGVNNFPATQNVQNVPGQALAIVSTGPITVNQGSPPWTFNVNGTTFTISNPGIIREIPGQAIPVVSTNTKIQGMQSTGTVAAINPVIIGGITDDGLVDSIDVDTGLGQKAIYAFSMPVQVDKALDNELFSTVVEFTLPTNGTETPFLYIKNLSTSTVSMYLDSAQMEVPVTRTTFRVYSGSTVTVSGSTVTINNEWQGSSVKSAMQVFSGPTVSANGTKRLVFGVAPQSNSLLVDFNFGMILQPGQTFLMTGTPTANSTAIAATLRWAEAP